MSTLTLKKIFFTGTFLSYILSVPCIASAPLFPYEEIPEDVKTELRQAAAGDEMIYDVMIKHNTSLPLTAERGPLVLEDGPAELTKMVGSMALTQEEPSVDATATAAAAADPSAEEDIYL